MPGWCRFSLTDFGENTVNIAHTGRVVLNPFLKRQLRPGGGVRLMLAVLRGHRDRQLGGGLVQAAAHRLTCQGLPAVITRQLADQAQQLIHLEPVVGCEIDRRQLGCTQAVVPCGTDNVHEGVTFEPANPDDDKLLRQAPLFTEHTLSAHPLTGSFREVFGQVVAQGDDLTEVLQHLADADAGNHAALSNQPAHHAVQHTLVITQHRVPCLQGGGGRQCTVQRGSLAKLEQFASHNKGTRHSVHTNIGFFRHTVGEGNTAQVHHLVGNAGADNLLTQRV